MAPKPKPKSLPHAANDDVPTLPDDVSITGRRLSQGDAIDGRAPDPGKEQDLVLETYEDKVDRASEERVVDAEKERSEP